MPHSTGDFLLTAADRALRALFAPAQASRPVPAPPQPASSQPESAAQTGAGSHGEPVLTADERRTAAALMRVNHAGEIAAQALYHGQAFAARAQATRELLLHAAREETDHLAWCESRLR